MIYSSSDIECDRLKLVIMGLFYPFTPPNPKNLKNQNSKKMKKLAGAIIILHMCTKKPQSYEVQFLRYRVRQTEFFVILSHFLPFYPPNNPDNQNFDKMKKASGDVIILHMCTKHYNHMMYVS